MKDEETTLGVTLFEGRNRQIRRMCEAVGLSVVSLTRTAIGSLSGQETAAIVSAISAVTRGQGKVIKIEKV